MIYYRVALYDSKLSAWRWKSSLLSSLHPVLGLLDLYRSMPKTCIRVFLSTSAEQMDVMLSRENLGLQSTALTVDQLYDKHRVSWIEVRRLEVETGEGGDHDQPYTWNAPFANSHALAWAKLLLKRERDELES